MEQTELLYGFNSVAIAILLFIAIIIFNELGFRIGSYIQARTNDEVKSLTGSIQASILGLLALLLGFTFSISMQRYDNRSMALIDEANMIRTAFMRAHLLPEAFSSEANTLLEQYVELRIEVSTVDITRREERRVFNARTDAIQDALWALAIDASRTDGSALTTGAFINTLTSLVEIQNKRNALLQLHAPEVVLLLLFLVFISAGGILGYSAGLSGKRITAPIVLVSFLITLIVFIIIDLDRPRRGLIQVNQSQLLDLQNTTAFRR